MLSWLSCLYLSDSLSLSLCLLLSYSLFCLCGVVVIDLAMAILVVLSSVVDRPAIAVAVVDDVLVLLLLLARRPCVPRSPLTLVALVNRRSSVW